MTATVLPAVGQPSPLTVAINAGTATVDIRRDPLSKGGGPGGEGASQYSAGTARWSGHRSPLDRGLRDTSMVMSWAGGLCLPGNQQVKFGQVHTGCPWRAWTDQRAIHVVLDSDLSPPHRQGRRRRPRSSRPNAPCTAHGRCQRFHQRRQPTHPGRAYPRWQDGHRHHR
jgi:hypothetical protein